MTAIALWTILAFLLGSVPFAYVLVMLVQGQDIRKVGSGNPGGMNAWGAAGWTVGVSVIILDFLKGAIPIGIAHQVYGIDGWAIVPVALAPILGHAYTPFLGFKGGKSVSVTYGVWAGLLSWPGMLMLAVGQGLFFVFLASDSWVTVLGAAAFTGFLALYGAGLPLVVIGAVNVAVFVQRYYSGLKEGLKPRINRPFRWIDNN